MAGWTCPDLQLIEWDGNVKAKKFIGDGSDLTGLPASGAPTDAKYIVQTANGSLTQEQALDTLATGLMQVTTGTGAITSVTTSTGLNTLITDNTGTGALVFADTPTLISPLLGTPTSGVLTNCTGLPVAGGGTGVSSQASYAIVLGGTTNTGALQAVSGTGTSGQFLFSQGGGKVPVWGTVASASAGAMTLIGTSTLGAEAGSISFTSIATGYKGFLLQFECAGADASSNYRVQFNNEVSNAYITRGMANEGSPSSYTGTTTCADFHGVAVTGALQDPVGMWMHITNHASTVNQKYWMAQTTFRASAIGVWATGAWTNKTIEINRIDMVCSNEMLVGTKMTLWGYT